jgi:L-ascorbate metabolism protein UlaG (beta-lactamase superfamily)
MDIYWLGHACFRLRSTTLGLSIITDPYASGVGGLGVQIDSRQTVDVVAVTVSHNDRMHNSAGELGGNPRVFISPGEYEFQGITIRAVMTPLSEGVARSKRNVAFAIALDGINVCHLGNITQPLTAQQIDLIGPAEVVLAPAGGSDHNLLSYRAINQTAQQLDAKWLIPMHYRAEREPSAVEPEGPETFLRELGVAEGSLQAQNRMQVTRNNLPPSLQVGLMAPQFRTQ